MIQTVRTADVRWLAGLEAVWPEGIEMRGGILIARVHPNNNRAEGDEMVICRAIVFIEDRLCRFTIRVRDITPSEEFPEYAQLYRTLLDAVMKLPVIELPA